MMMKKMMMTAMMILVAAACCFAYNNTQTITLVSRVEKRDPMYIIRNNETGETGASVHYITEQIAEQDVCASFDILQSCDSNGVNMVGFKVCATELMAVVGGRVYSTGGVSIVIDGIGYGSTAEFVRTTVGAVAAGSVVESFEVIWSTDSQLVQASYMACVTLEATAL